jgi:uncharacterized protein YcfL
MRKFILLTLVSFTLTFCKNNSEIQTEQNVPETSVMSKSESDQKLIEVCKNMDGIVDADIKDDILTVRANISKNEAQKLSDGMLSEIKKYNEYIKTVMVVDLEYQILGYSGK